MMMNQWMVFFPVEDPWTGCTQWEDGPISRIWPQLAHGALTFYLFQGVSEQCGILPRITTPYIMSPALRSRRSARASNNSFRFLGPLATSDYLAPLGPTEVALAVTALAVRGFGQGLGSGSCLFLFLGGLNSECLENFRGEHEVPKPSDFRGIRQFRTSSDLHNLTHRLFFFCAGFLDRRISWRAEALSSMPFGIGYQESVVKGTGTWI